MVSSPLFRTAKPWPLSVGVIKPDPRIFKLLIERFAIPPEGSVYIDDIETNAVAARPFGIHAIHFTTPAALRQELVELGLLRSHPARLRS